MSLTGLFGQGIGQAIGAYNHLGSAHAAQQAQSGCGTAYLQGAMNQQQMAQHNAMMAQQNMSQGQMGATGPAGFGVGGFGGVYDPVKWMIDGKSMTFEDFINTIYPEECAEKTMLILRLKREDVK